MGILNYLPTFHSVEINRSTGLVMGHVLSQNEAGEDLTLVTKGSYDFLENGIIVGLSNNRKIENYDLEKHSQPFFVFSEELNTFMSGLKYFAQDANDEEGFHPRAVALYPGDAFTTNNYSGVFGLNTAYAKVIDGVLTLQNTADDYTIFAVNLSSMPADGSTAVQFVYLGINQGQIAEIWDEITFVLNGGTWDESTDDVVVMGIQGRTISSYALDPEPTLEGHEFIGWFYDNNVFAEPVLEEDILSEDIEIYALFDPIMFNIIYNIGDASWGEGASFPNEFSILDLPLTIETDINLADHTFEGWYDNEDLLGDPITEITELADIELYVNFVPTVYEITYELDGGENDPSNPETFTIEDLPVTIQEATKEGYDFLGWHLTPELDSPIASIVETGDTTLYADFSPTVYEILYEPGVGGEWEEGQEGPTIFTIEDLPVSISNAFNQEGYIFDGWYDNEALTGDPVVEITELGTITLWSKWTAIEYEINYTMNGGDNDPSNPETFTIEDLPITLAAPTKPDFVFDGWTLEDNVTTITEISEIGDINLYAQ